MDAGGVDAPRRRALLPFVAAVAVVLVGLVVVLVVTLSSGPASTHAVQVATADGFTASGWSLTGEAALDSSDHRGTDLAVEVRRDTVSAALPALTGEFSAGGATVTCAAGAGTAWAAAVGDTQVLRLPCDRSVAPAALSAVRVATVATGR